MAYSAARRGTGIARRTSDYIKDKIDHELAVIAVNPDNGDWVGFCCIEAWSHERYIANTGLIVSPQYRNLGVSTEIKKVLFDLGRKKFPVATIFSLSTSPAVIHTNTLLGYRTVSFDEILTDPLFTEGCHTWVNYVELMSRGVHSHYVAMVYEPSIQTELTAYSSSGKLLGRRLKFIRKKKSKKTTMRQLVPQLSASA